MNKEVRFVLNTKFPDTPASKVCHVALSNYLKAAGFPVVLNDWDNYDRYDVAVFMSYDPDIQKARRQNPDILIGYADPKTSVHIEHAGNADFLLVSSYEQRDKFLKYNPDIFIYYMFPEVKHIPKTHAASDKIIIGYHGNKIHLNCLYPNVILAMERLSRYFEVEFWALYDHETLGKWSIGLPDPSKVTVRHINKTSNWPEEKYREIMPQIDIGIVPTLIPMKVPGLVERISRRSKICFLEDKNDYITRYKCSSGPGRIYVFAMMEIPVVTDFFPSGARFVDHGETGFLCYTAEGWFDAFYRLASDHELRNRVAQNSLDFFRSYAAPEITFNSFLSFLDPLLKARQNSGQTVEAKELRAGIFRNVMYNVDIKLEHYIAPHIRKAKKLAGLISK